MNTMAEKNTDILLDQALHEIHLTVWSRFINENNLLLDYTELSGNISLPTPDECEQNQPNALGWWSPIENGGFFNGDYLLGLLAAYRYAEQTGEDSEIRKRKTEIRRLVQGLLLIQDVCETDGCICRGVGSDGYCHYPGSSDDQISPWLLALDAYMESGIPSEGEVKVCRSHLLRQLDGLYANNWTVPGDRPGFERGSYISRDGVYEAWLGAIHLLTALHIYGKVLPEKRALFMKYWNEPLFDGKSPKMLIEEGLPEFRVNSIWYLSHSCYALRMFQDRQEEEVRKICRKCLRQVAEMTLPCLRRWQDYVPGLSFDPDWRKMLIPWKPQNSCSEAAALACGEMGFLWHRKISPAIGMEKNSILDFSAAMWLMMISQDSSLIKLSMEELRKAAPMIPWSRLHYAGFFFVENALWEWKLCEFKNAQRSSREI